MSGRGGAVEFSEEFRELTEIRYMFIMCFVRKCRKKGVEFRADFLKQQFQKLLEPPSGMHIATLQGHTQSLFCLTVDRNKLYSGSYDKTIRVWDTDTHRHIATLQGHTDPVQCLTVVGIGDKLYSGSWDKTIRVWDTDMHRHIATLQGHTDKVQGITVAGNKLYSGSEDNTIRVWAL